MDKETKAIQEGIIHATIQSDKEALSHYEKQIYDLQQMLEISRSLCTTLELPNLIESVLYIVMAQMRVMGAGIFIKESIENSDFYLKRNYSGLEIDPSRDYKISSHSVFCEKIAEFGSVFTLDDLEPALSDTEEFKMLKEINPSLIVILSVKNHINGFLILGERIAIDVDGATYTDYERNEIGTIASLASIAVNNASLVEQSSTDMMTHLKLRYYFFNILTDKIDACFSQKEKLCVLMLDIDFFKKFNDTYGHACADYVLQTVARIIKSNIRNDDMASRYGGEEFTVMLPVTAREEAMLVAERIRKSVEDFDFFYQNEHMKVTLSVGVSEFSVDENPVTNAKELVDQADKALYYSKRTGRNKVSFADEQVIAEIDRENQQ